MLDVLDHLVLVLEPTVHLLIEVLLLFIELSQLLPLESFNSLVLLLDLLVNLSLQLLLLLKSFSFFNCDCFLDLL